MGCHHGLYEATSLLPFIGYRTSGFWTPRLNCTIRDAEGAFATKVVRIRELLKRVRGSAYLLGKFKPFQDALDTNADGVCDVPGLDVDTRCISMLTMVRDCVKHCFVFEEIRKKRKSSVVMSQYLLADEYWNELDGLTDFLANAFRFTRASSGSSYVSLSFLPMIYDALKSQCIRTISQLESECSTANVTKRSAIFMMEKLSKHRLTLWCNLTERAQMLDPWISNAQVPSESRAKFRNLQTSKYGLGISVPDVSDDSIE